MNGYTNHFPISSKFRFIVIGQEATCRDLLPPFINRFVKTNLNFSSALSLAQHNLAGYLRLKAEAPSGMNMFMCFFCMLVCCGIVTYTCLKNEICE